MKPMKAFISICLFLTSAIWCGATPFSAVPAADDFGVGVTAWRFASSLSADATGTIEVVFTPVNGSERVIGRIGVRPFESSESKIPDVHVLFSTAKVDGRSHVVLIIGYGIRSGTFVVDDPDLTSKSRVADGLPAANSAGEHCLLTLGENSMNFVSGEGVVGHLILRYR